MKNEKPNNAIQYNTCITCDLTTRVQRFPIPPVRVFRLQSYLWFEFGWRGVRQRRHALLEEMDMEPHKWMQEGCDSSQEMRTMAADAEDKCKCLPGKLVLRPQGLKKKIERDLYVWEWFWICVLMEWIFSNWPLKKVTHKNNIYSIYIQREREKERPLYKCSCLCNNTFFPFKLF